jgi:hypothetical protein
LTKAGVAATGPDRTAVRRVLARRASLMGGITDKEDLEWVGAAQRSKNKPRMA